MTPLISFLIIAALSLLVIRIATVALTLTGLSRDVALFQARSAFTGAGFTTVESEQVVSHPVRRRIILLLMTLGNLGIVTAVSSLLLTFVEAGADQTRSMRLLWLVLGLLLVWAIAASSWVDRYLTRLIEHLLRRWTALDVRDYAALLDLIGDYAVVELTVVEGEWLADKTLAELDLVDEGIIILGVLRSDGTYIGAPKGYTAIVPDDTLILYGRQELLTTLNTRLVGKSGNAAHREAIRQQEIILEHQRLDDEISAHSAAE